MGNKFDFDSAQEFAAMLTKAAEVMQTETENINREFQVLGDTFRDQNYIEFKTDVDKATATINNVASDIYALRAAILDYADKLSTVLNQ